jgi:cytochrome c oxidase accessory protein FixG
VNGFSTVTPVARTAGARRWCAPESRCAVKTQPTEEANVAVQEAVQSVNWDDFRDHLATADKEGRRKWIYARQPRGRFYTARTWVSVALLAILFVGPFIRIHGNPLLLVDIVERKFAVLGKMFWPQDGVVLAIGLLVFITGIVVFTAAFGRLWCGWTCPQTVLMEMVFRRLEYWIEGDAAAQRALARAPWTGSKVVKKAGKHLLFFALSFLIGNTLLAYIIGTEKLVEIVTDNPLNHLQGLTFMILFTLVFYAIFARFREQACTFICPYGRFQSTLLDENSIVVAYDHKRGERRGYLHRNQPADPRRAAGYGDCIDCRQCVTVCPTGIDIRNGTQMECVHCTACMDACDAVMEKIDRPRGLIRYASLNGIERGERLRVTPRLVGYSVILLSLVALEAFLLFTRPDVQATFLRAQGALFQQMPNGKISNLYTVKLINKTAREVPVQLRLQEPEGTLTVMGNDLVVPPQQLAQASVLIELDPARLRGAQTPLVIGVFSNGRWLQTLKTAFVGPRDDTRRPAS